MSIHTTVPFTLLHVDKAIRHLEYAIHHLEESDETIDTLLIDCHKQSLQHLRELRYITDPSPVTVSKHHLPTYQRNLSIYRAVLAGVPYKRIAHEHRITPRRIMQICTHTKRKLTALAGVI